MADYKLIPTQVLSNVVEVRLYDETVEHAAEHLEGPYFATQDRRVAIEVVTRAIQDPTYVEASYRDDSVVYIDETSRNEGGHPLRVPVKIFPGNSGLVKTWFFGTTATQRRVIYRKSDDV